MKKTYFAVITMAAVLFSACGSTQKVANQSGTSTTANPYGVVQESNVCIDLQEQDPVRRQYGMGQHFKESTAGNLAEAQARGAFARKVRSAVLSATDEINLAMEVHSHNQANGGAVSDQTSTTNDWTNSVAVAVVNNLITIKTLRYYDAEKQIWTIFKCLEYNGTVEEMASKIVESIKEQISPDDKARIEAQNDKFRQSVIKSLSVPVQ